MATTEQQGKSVEERKVLTATDIEAINAYKKAKESQNGK